MWRRILAFAGEAVLGIRGRTGSNQAKSVHEPRLPHRQSSRESQKVANRKIELILFRRFCTLEEIVRLLVEILVIGGLIYLGWEQPFKERVDQVRARVTGKQVQAAPQEVGPMTPMPTRAPRIVPGIVRGPTPSHGAWRLDPTHRSPLDPPVRESPSPH